MRINITLDSSCEGSSSKLFIKNVEESDNEVLLTIDSASCRIDIYVLLDQLKEAINKIG